MRKHVLFLLTVSGCYICAIVTRVMYEVLVCCINGGLHCDLGHDRNLRRDTVSATLGSLERMLQLAAGKRKRPPPCRSGPSRRPC